MNNAKSRTFNSALVQLDHDYCSSVNTTFHNKSNNSNSSKYNRSSS